jgi:hypothetical protein
MVVMQRLGTAFALVLAAAVWTAKAQPAPRGQDIPEAEFRQAREAAAGLGQEIRRLLMNELQKGGLSGAVQACAAQAQQATARFAGENGVAIRRISLKYRNAKDQPDDWERNQLERWEAALRDGTAPAEVAMVQGLPGNRTLRYLKPIRVESMCLSCHGSGGQINAQVRAAILRHYPDDRAIGYREGDLRGAFSVAIRLLEP